MAHGEDEEHLKYDIGVDEREKRQLRHGPQLQESTIQRLGRWDRSNEREWNSREREEGPSSARGETKKWHWSLVRGWGGVSCELCVSGDYLLYHPLLRRTDGRSR
mmetsp:Transcript_29681/g.62436  ORF Transcript_29681/g.62436 Transcript_29681/m.62436 type:complete len:105 (-) Transcript_29681:415-729(-)